MTGKHYTVRGKVIREGKAVPAIKVEALDHDRGRPPTHLEDADTDDQGNFEIVFTQSQAGGRGEGKPELILMLKALDGSTTFKSSPRQLDFGVTDWGTIDLSGNEAASIGIGAGEVAGSPGATPGTTPEPGDPSAQVGQAKVHGSTTREMLVPKSTFFMGPFGRMFRKLPAWVPVGTTESEKDTNIRAIAETMFNEEGAGSNLDNPKIPAGYTYFGQFVDHDITFDPTSSLTKQNDPNRLHNFRTPRFDLDNIYGEGPDDEPFMYEAKDAGRFLIGAGKGQGEHDLPRNVEGVAIIGDKRNDENIVVSQLQLAFLKLHNVIINRVRVEEGRTGKDAFDRAQEILRFHYQHVVLFDFLPKLCGEDFVRTLIDFDDPDPNDIKLRFYKFKEAPYMPVEFSVAAYRLGHSMVRGQYDLNRIVTSRPIFTANPNAGELDDLRGFRPLPGFWTLDWARFLEVRAGGVVQHSRRIDAKLSNALRIIHPGAASLAELNLIRGRRMGLPSGQAVARSMKLPVLTNADLGLDSAIAGKEAPLWFYILKEAELSGGEHLGQVGGRIVAEVFLGLAKADPNSFLNLDPSWSPATSINGGPLVDTGGDRVRLHHLIQAAGLAKDPFP